MEKLIKSSFSKTMIPIFDKGKVKSVHINPTLMSELFFTFEYKKLSNIREVKLATWMSDYNP